MSAKRYYWTSWALWKRRNMTSKSGLAQNVSWRDGARAAWPWPTVAQLISCSHGQQGQKMIHPHVTPLHKVDRRSIISRDVECDSRSVGDNHGGFSFDSEVTFPSFSKFSDLFLFIKISNLPFLSFLLYIRSILKISKRDIRYVTITRPHFILYNNYISFYN